MNIAWIIPCRYVEVHDNLGTIIGAGIDTFWMSDLPAPVQIFLAIRLVGLPHEFDEDVKHAVTNRVRGPNGDVLTELRGEIAVAAESARPDWVAGVILPAVAQFEAVVEGTYMIEFDVAGVTSALPIHVVHGLPPGAQP